MAEITVLEGNTSQQWKAVFHVPVPSGMNAVGITWFDAVVNSGMGLNTETGRRSILSAGTGPGKISPSEEINLNQGEIFEIIVFIPLESGGDSSAELTATLREYYLASNTDFQNSVVERLRYFGLEETAL